MDLNSKAWISSQGDSLVSISQMPVSVAEFMANDPGFGGRCCGSFRVARPRHVLVENVAALSHRGLGDVLRGLAECGFDAEWDCIPAAAVGARHFRNRIFVVATARSVDYSDCFGEGCIEGLRGTRRWMQEHSVGRCFDGGPWSTESGMDRVAYGVPRGLDRFIRLGNAVVPQVAEHIGRRILAA